MTSKKLYVVLVLSPRNTILNLYKNDDLEILKDDLFLQYNISNEIEELITTGQAVTPRNLKFQMKTFEY